jgi:hypothetical protein
MQTYRSTAPRVQVARQHLALVAALVTRDDGTTAAAIARDHGVSRAQVYKLADRAITALGPRTPGPPPGAAAVAHAQVRVTALEADLAATRARVAALEAQHARSIEVTTRRAHALELVLTVENVSHRGIQRIFDVAFDGQACPSLGGLNARLRTAGRAARDLLTAARTQVRDVLTCVMGDDIFFAGTAVKVVAEPRSVAILNLGRWRWHAAEDWALWLEAFGALRLFVSDVGSDLVGAIDARQVPHAADFFHELQWWNGVIFAPLATCEADLRAAYLKALDVATTPFSWRSRHDAPKVAAAARAADQAEAEFFLVYAAVERIRGLYQPLRPDGTCWTGAAVATELTAIDGLLAQVTHPRGARARKHVAIYGHRYAAHRHLLDAIAVDLRPGSPWTPHAVLQGLVHQWALEAHTDDVTRPMMERLTAQRQARRLATRLRTQCRNLDVVAHALRRHLTSPPRSSSGIESLNSQLRVLQMVHRTVNDDLLALHALAWNLTPRGDGRRKGRTPYAMLGVDLGQGDKPWYDVVLDAQAA